MFLRLVWLSAVLLLSTSCATTKYIANKDIVENRVRVLGKCKSSSKVSEAVSIARDNGDEDIKVICNHGEARIESNIVTSHLIGAYKIPCRKGLFMRRRIFDCFFLQEAPVTKGIQANEIEFSKFEQGNEYYVRFKRVQTVSYGVVFDGGWHNILVVREILSQQKSLKQRIFYGTHFDKKSGFNIDDEIYLYRANNEARKPNYIKAKKIQPTIVSGKLEVGDKTSLIKVKFWFDPSIDAAHQEKMLGRAKLFLQSRIFLPYEKDKFKKEKFFKDLEGEINKVKSDYRSYALNRQLVHMELSSRGNNMNYSIGIISAPEYSSSL